MSTAERFLQVSGCALLPQKILHPVGYDQRNLAYSPVQVAIPHLFTAVLFDKKPDVSDLPDNNATVIYVHLWTML